MQAALRNHWPEYLMEAAGLAVLVFASAVAAVLIDAMMFPARGALGPVERRLVEGGGLAVVGVALIYSRWGRQSGAHYNPALTLSFVALGKVRHWDGLFYAVAHLIGGLVGLLAAALVLGASLERPPVAWTLAMPGGWGVGAAFAAEFASSFVVLSLLLLIGGQARLEPYLGVADVVLNLALLLLVAPISGYSLNPARSLASAVLSGNYHSLWLYLVAPPLGMLAAAMANRHLVPARKMPCAKLRHEGSVRCIHCGYEPDLGGRVGK